MMTDNLGPLRKAFEEAICNAVSGKEIAIAFSGGLDSGVVAAIAKGHAKRATLYTAGSEGSHDVKEAGTAAAELNMRLVIIPITEHDVKESLREMIRITGMRDPVTLSFEIPLFHVCKNCEEDEIISGQGADELFAGYSKYIGLGDDVLKEKIAEDMRKLFGSTLPHERMMAEHFGKKIHYPFLDEAVMREAGRFCLTAPTDDPQSRKRALRELSHSIGLTGISVKEKKAAQYGSGAMAIIRKMCTDSGMTYTELIEVLCGEAE
ncbi:MAG: asparagine synthase-related protein [Methanomassiliicoccaceae archaeon]|nr:asparagine synthase-related protein [Methanomassiliicoccaceae archaeon]